MDIGIIQFKKLDKPCLHGHLKLSLWSQVRNDCWRTRHKSRLAQETVWFGLVCLYWDCWRSTGQDYLSEQDVWGAGWPDGDKEGGNLGWGDYSGKDGTINDGTIWYCICKHHPMFRLGGKRSQRSRCWKLRGEISRCYMHFLLDQNWIQWVLRNIMVLHSATYYKIKSKLGVIRIQLTHKVSHNDP